MQYKRHKRGEKMKRKLIFSMFLLLGFVSFNYFVYGKYKIEKKLVAVTIQIDQTKPKLEVIYSTKEMNKEQVEVTISANEEIKNIQGWTLQKDKKTLKKLYKQNKTETIRVEDLSNNITEVEIKIGNIYEKTIES